MTAKPNRRGCSGVAGVVLLATWLVGCETTGIGTGSVRNGAATQVVFEWRAADATTGTLTASFANGRKFAGQYFQVTSETRIDRLDPLWAGWSPAWRGWRHWDMEPGPTFVRHYSGRVVANLAAENGERMRCRFRLVRPASGMAGGGEGTCQLVDGMSIRATFPAV